MPGITPLHPDIDWNDVVICVLHALLRIVGHLVKITLLTDLPTEEHAIALREFLRSKGVRVLHVSASDIEKGKGRAYRDSLSVKTFNGSCPCMFILYLLLFVSVFFTWLKST